MNIFPAAFAEVLQQKRVFILEFHIHFSVVMCRYMLQVAQCVDTLCRYLQNIMQNPTEEKFQKIRMSNRVYQERVAPLEGIQDFLIAAGFKAMKLPFQDGEEDFWVFSEDNLDSNETLQVSVLYLFFERMIGCSTFCDMLVTIYETTCWHNPYDFIFQILYDALQSAEPISLELDRNLQVLLPSQAAKRTDLPPVFFNITAEELKREQQMRFVEKFAVPLILVRIVLISTLVHGMCIISHLAVGNWLPLHT
jgi:UBX domain-containing protein 6